MNLTDSQRRAVETTSPQCLVIAGAGSGKTSVLTERIAWLLEQGASAQDFLVLTFTRKAAQELRERLRARIGKDADLHGMMMGTFHSVALSILRARGNWLGYDGDKLTVIEPDDVTMFLEMVAQELGYFADGKWKSGLSQKKLITLLERIYTGREHIDDATGLMASDPAHRIIKEYWGRLRLMNTLDYGLILRECNTLLARRFDVLHEYRVRIKHVMVDELQDADETQYTLHDWFARPVGPATFFGVGDPRQSIYGFRGARPDLIRKRHSDAEIIDLCECFRCGDRIVVAANTLISKGEDRVTPMVGATDREGEVRLLWGRSAGIGSAVQEINATTNYAWGEIAILARRHTTLVRLAEVLRDRHIPHHRVGQRFDVTQTREFRFIHAILRLVVNQKDDVAFTRFAKPYFTPQQFAELRMTAAQHGVPLSTAYGAMEHRGPMRELYRSLVGASKVPEAAIDDHTEWIATELSTAGDGLPMPFTLVFGFWRAFTEGLPVSEALRWFALRDQTDDATVGNKVTLATIHGAKGLEWPVVLIANLMEGDLPSSQASREPGGIEEERRVAYVGMTRARERLILHYRRPQDQAVDRTPQEPSRFLAEAGFDVCSLESALEANYKEEN